METDLPPEERDPVRETVETIATMHRQYESRVDPHQRGIERITAAMGRPRFLYIILTVVVVWISFNIAMVRMGKEPPDAPPFYWLQGLVGFSALATTVMILITQYRQDHAAERRAQLDLQISILIEQKVTKLIVLVEELRLDMPNVKNRKDPEVERLTQTADVATVVEQLNQLLDEAEDSAGAVLAEGEALRLD